MDRKILITKDAFRKDYLPCYGNTFWNTPNIDELSSNGTVFNNHYTAGASTAMAVTSMFTGKNSFELKRKKYEEVNEFDEGETLFDELHKVGYNTFVIWPFEWKELAWKYSKVFPKDTKIIGLAGLYQDISPNKERLLVYNEKKSDNVIDNIIKEIEEIIDQSDKSFIWVHLPHVVNGYTSYGSDIEFFDKFIGSIRKLFDDNSIYISSDHGHMNLEKGIPVYGFHLYDGTICIPLITPRINNTKKIDFPTSNTQLKEIILRNEVSKQRYIYSDTQYYLQPNRKLAIIKNNYKYIFNKIDKTEELYDLEFDPHENVNLLLAKCYDYNRNGYYNLNEIYYYKWDRLDDIYFELKHEKNRIWKSGLFLQEFISKIKLIIKEGFHSKIKNILLHKKRIGLYNSVVKEQSIY